MVSFNDIKSQRDKIAELAEKRGVRNIRVFGSFARGDADENSDLDLLVSMDEDRSLLDRIGFMHDVEDLLHIKVDVVNENALHHSIREEVIKDGVLL
ncbi:MAG: nucleotidyltransferase family protein [Phycisphaerae bacterium]|nr:nucleotidyltransferase family protein [Phycisphaerae bacterium]